MVLDDDGLGILTAARPQIFQPFFASMRAEQQIRVVAIWSWRSYGGSWRYTRADRGEGERIGWGAIYADFSSRLKEVYLIDLVDPHNFYDQFHLRGYSLNDQIKHA